MRLKKILDQGRQNYTQLSKNKKMPKIFKLSAFLLFSLIITLSFSCIYQISSITQEKYLLQDYQNQVKKIFREKGAFSYQKNNAPSLSMVESVAKEKYFTKTEEVTYIKVSSGEVVIR